MKIAFFSVQSFEKPFFEEANKGLHKIKYFEASLNESTTDLVGDADCVCVFVNDNMNAKVIELLKAKGVRLIALRSAGFNHVDVPAAIRFGVPVVRVPEYSPYAVAEHTVGLLLALNRKIHRAYNRVREANFSLDGLVGFDLHGKTVGVIGTGKIGRVFCKIMLGFGCRILAYDPYPAEDLKSRGVDYVSLDDLISQADIISLHVPLMPETHHIISGDVLKKMKKGALLVNTSRGGLVDTKALIDALKNGHVAGAALDVYEEEEGLFFHDLSNIVLQDDQIARLLTFPNVLITAHQAFLTQEALRGIAETTIQNINDFESGRMLANEVKL